LLVLDMERKRGNGGLDRIYLTNNLCRCLVLVLRCAAIVMIDINLI
jgi:hypothetical protein